MKRAMLVLVVLALAGCTSTQAAAPPASPRPSPAMLGVVVGGVQPCQGIEIPNSPRYAAATVTVLAGKLVQPSSGPTIFPTTVVATQSVAVDETYRFELPPGPYVLQASFPPPANVLPFVQVTVIAGRILHVDVPNMCM